MWKILALSCGFAFAVPALGFAAQSQPSQAAAPGVSTPLTQPKSDQSAGLTNQDKTLGQRLSESNGTIHPPAVDPQMAKSPPPDQLGTMPVLRPPASQQSK